MEAAGWIGNFFLAICGVPQAIKAIEEHDAQGVSGGFLFLWGTGEILAGIYAIFCLPYPSNAPILLNVTLNVALVAIISFYKITGNKC